MSLSRPQSNNPNPAKKFIEFKNGEFSFYDKEMKENVKVDLPIRFTVCDELSTITGYSDEHKNGIYSNEVHKTTLEPLIVKVQKGGQIAKGLYQEIKGDIVAAGGKYAKTVYAYMNGELVNFKLAGAALSAWINKDKKGVDVSKQSIEVRETEEIEKSKAVKYSVPIFEGIDMLDEEEAKAADDVLQKYLDEKKIVKVEKDTDEESREFQEKYEDFDPDPPEDNRHPHTKRAGEALKAFETGAKPEPREAPQDMPFPSSSPSL